MTRNSNESRGLKWTDVTLGTLCLVFLVTMALIGAQSRRAPAAPAPAVTVAPVAAPVPEWETIPNCEDEQVPPRYTKDEGHWLVVTSYHPYHALVLDDMVTVIERDARERG